MDYIELIQKTIDYIDANIQKEITVDKLASIAGFSTYHYYRIFSSFVGFSVMEYVTKRKLQFALFELQDGKKIIDVAIDYGFETHAGFTKAFKRCFGYPPSLYRLHAPKNLPSKIILSKLIINKTGGIIMEPKIIERDSFKIVGFEFKNNLKNILHTRDIPAFWSQRGLSDGACETKLYSTLKPPKHGEYCICINTNMETDDFSYILGGDREDYKIRIPSPFPQENLGLLLADNISTKYKNRELSYEKVAESIYSVAKPKRGNYIAYFPSYKYMKNNQAE
jgi:AraC family transcriptional regulator